MQATHSPGTQDVVKALMAMAVIYDKQLTEAAADMLVQDLSEHDPFTILRALKLCRLELNRFPTTAEILKRLNPSSEISQVQEIIGTIFKAINWYGYPNPEGARSMIGNVGWKAVEFFGGWQSLCDSPGDDLSILRGQLRKAVEAAVEEKTRCDVIGIPLREHTPKEVYFSSNSSPLRHISFDSFLPGGTT
jgi:hypothetical protein